MAVLGPVPPNTTGSYVSLFAALVYTKAWTSCQSATAASSNDLCLLKSLVRYKAISEGTSAAAFNALSRHLRYISEELIALAFFDSNTNNATKRKMVDSLQHSGPNEPPIRIQIELNLVECKQLEDFVSVNMMNFFEILQLATNFLTQVEPDQWEHDEGYKKAKHCAESLRVVNDVSESGIKLIQDFNLSVTRNEEKRQYLLQIVAQHTAQFPEAKKSLLLCGHNSNDLH
jgi:hypothetical protein